MVVRRGVRLVRSSSQGGEVHVFEASGKDLSLLKRFSLEVRREVAAVGLQT